MAAEHIEYLLQGIEDGPMRSVHAFQLAEMCSNKHIEEKSTTSSEVVNGRFLLRAHGGWLELMRMLEATVIEPTSESHTFMYCMMALLYLITLDAENAKVLRVEAFRKIVQVLHHCDAKFWDNMEPEALASSQPTLKHKYLKKKKSITRPNGFDSSIEQLQPLLRLEAMYMNAKVTVPLYDLALGVLYNSLLDIETQKFGMTQSIKAVSNSACVAERKQVLRIERVMESVLKHLESSPAQCLRLLSQASYLDRDNQIFLVQQPNFVVNLLRSLSSDKYDRDTRLLALSVLINITHKYHIACDYVCKHRGTHDLLKYFTLIDSSDFDSKVLVLSALVNCVELNDENHSHVVAYMMPNGTSTVDTLIAFLTKHTPLDIPEELQPQDIILSGAAALLLGCLVKSDASIVDKLPSTAHLLTVLVNFVQLQSQLGALTQEMLDSCLQVEQRIKKITIDDSPSLIQATILGVDSDVAPLLTKLSQSSTNSSPLVDGLLASPSLDTVQVTMVDGASTPPPDAFRLRVVSSTESESIPKTRRKIKLTDDPSPPATTSTKRPSRFNTPRTKPAKPLSKAGTTSPKLRKLSTLRVPHTDNSQRKRALERKSTPSRQELSFTPNKRKPQKQLLDVFEFDE